MTFKPKTVMDLSNNENPSNVLIKNDTSFNIANPELARQRNLHDKQRRLLATAG
jgi:hypothetical protein